MTAVYSIKLGQLIYHFSSLCRLSRGENRDSSNLPSWELLAKRTKKRRRRKEDEEKTSHQADEEKKKFQADEEKTSHQADEEKRSFKQTKKRRATKQMKKKRSFKQTKKRSSKQTKSDAKISSSINKFLPVRWVWGCYYPQAYSAKVGLVRSVLSPSNPGLEGSHGSNWNMLCRLGNHECFKKQMLALAWDRHLVSRINWLEFLKKELVIQ